ncbi:mitochondrial integral membrane protein [Chryseobacterium sp. StRB126]|uniref:hypothetical protein n=1 Tax=Chryseobacterium sp. StRB126 TaxID=878220 RepID=UPI0004E9901A|nr:hypothetical protein [Chryseobacterium sp. StRB126]BAP33630.1 mitochondrial integral membrane protein [Chryseobacterium sp. StRB126]
MHKVLFIFIFLFCSKYLFSQETYIKFQHSNAIIVGKKVDILFEVSKRNKVKVFVKKNRSREYSSKISKKRFDKIYSAILKIKNDTISVKNNLIDGSFTTITLNDSLGSKKKYHASGLNSKSQSSASQKDFWYATKLIIVSSGLEMEDLIDYK